MPGQSGISMLGQEKLARISGIDRGLDMQCDIVFAWNDPLMDFLRKLPSKAPGFLSFSGETSTIRYYLPGAIDNSIDVKRNLTVLGASRVNDLWVIEQDVSNTPVSKVIDSLINVRSAVLDMVMYENGKLMFRFRFHRNYRKEISEIILKNAVQNDFFSVEYLGESHGLLSTLKEISSYNHLSAVEFQIVFPDEYKSGIGNPLKGSWIRIRKIDAGSMKFRHIYYAPEGLVPEKSMEADVISEEDHLYELITTNPVIGHIMLETEKRKIYTAWINRFDSGTIYGRIWLNSMNVKEFIEVIDSARKKFQNWNISVRMVCSIEDILAHSDQDFFWS
jgi:hypothetical protein